MPRPRGATILVSAVLVVSLGALIVDLVLAGPDPADEFNQQALRTWVLPILTWLLLAAILYLIRRSVIIRRAANAGAIEITTSATTTGAVADEIIAELSQALIQVELSSPSVVPGESAPQDFLKEVRAASTGASTWWALVGSLADVLWPRGVYRVLLVARPDPGGNRHGLTVEVSSRVSHDVHVATVWAGSWSVAARRAACHVAAYVLPRTSLSRVPPWTPWRGIELDPDLFYLFHEARRLAGEGRLEEALDHFDQALAKDPLNPYLRLERATVLEQLALYVDAVAVYLDVVAIESWYDRGVWRRHRKLLADTRTLLPPPPAARRFRSSPNGPAALQLARYRMICSLAAGERLAQQWSSHLEPRERGREAAGSGAREPIRRREEARRVLDRLGPLLTPYSTQLRTGDGSAAPGEFEPGGARFRETLQFAALAESRALERDYRWSRARRWRRWRMLPIPQRALRNLPVWAAIQYRAAASGSPPSTKQVERLVRWAVDRWPFGFWRFRRWRAGTGRGWLEHYNAACTFAVSLTLRLQHCGSRRTAPGTEEERLARLAVDQLEQAVVATDSRFVAGQSPWLRWGDQDLDELRVTPFYRAFLDRYLPTGTPPPHVPRNAAVLAMTGHVTRLVAEFARLRAAIWRRHLEQGGQLTARLLREESMWWQRLRDCCHHYGDWRTRHRLIALANESALDAREFDPAMRPVEADDRWSAVAGAVVAEIRGTGDRSAVHVTTWLAVSHALRTAAEGLRRHRNQALAQLGMALDRGPTLVELAARLEPESLPSQAHTRIVRDLTAAWAAIEAWMQDLLDRPPAGADPEAADPRPGRTTLDRVASLHHRLGRLSPGWRRLALRGRQRLRDG